MERQEMLHHYLQAFMNSDDDTQRLPGALLRRLLKPVRVPRQGKEPNHSTTYTTTKPDIQKMMRRSSTMDVTTKTIIFDTKPKAQTPTASTFALFYLNNVETDRRYKQFPASLRQLFRPAYPGQYRPIAKNIMTVHVALRPHWPRDMRVLLAALRMVRDNVPVRFGMALVVADGEDEVAHEMACRFSYLYRDMGLVRSMAFLEALAKNVIAMEGGSDDDGPSQLTRAQLRALYASSAPKSHPFNIDMEQACATHVAQGVSVQADAPVWLTDVVQSRSHWAAFGLTSPASRSIMPAAFMNGHLVENVDQVRATLSIYFC